MNVPSPMELRDSNRHLVLAAVREQGLGDSAHDEAGPIHALVEQLDAGVLLLDLDGRIRLMNRVSRELFGCSLAPGSRLEMLGAAFESAGGPGLQLAMSPFDRLLAGHEFSDCEVVLVRADGGRRRVSINATILRDEQRRPIAMMALLHDVSELRALEQMREEYIALLSHDLCSPLSGVTLFSSLLERVLASKGLSAEAANAGRILKNARQLTALIQEMLESTRLEAGTAALRKSMIDVSEVIRDSCGALSSPEEGRIEIDCEDRLVLFADELRLKRALTNLISNALKYSPPDQPVKVTCRMTDTELTVSVADHGLGIAPQHVPHLFTKYYRAGQSGRKDSIGLGLYIVRLIVECHGGRIWVDTKPEEGTTFCFSVPVQT